MLVHDCDCCQKHKRRGFVLLGPVFYVKSTKWSHFVLLKRKTCVTCYLIRLRNSLRVRSSRRKMPLKADVVVTALAFWTPRSVMQV